MRAKAFTITKDTGVSLALVIVIAGAVAGYATLKAEVKSHADKFVAQDSQNKEVVVMMSEQKAVLAVHTEQLSAIKQTVEKFDRKLERVAR